MWSSERRLFLAGLAALGLAGCGFTPVYAPGSPAARLSGRIAVAPLAGRDGFALVEALERRIGVPGTDGALYELSLDLEVRSADASIVSSVIQARFDLFGEAGFALRAAGGEDILLAGRVAATTSYGATATTLATRAAERDARSRLMGLLADRIMARLEAAAPGLAP